MQANDPYVQANALKQQLEQGTVTLNQMEPLPGGSGCAFRYQNFVVKASLSTQTEQLEQLTKDYNLLRRIGKALQETKEMDDARTPLFQERTSGEYLGPFNIHDGRRVYLMEFVEGTFFKSTKAQVEKAICVGFDCKSLTEEKEANFEDHRTVLKTQIEQILGLPPIGDFQCIVSEGSAKVFIIDPDPDSNRGDQFFKIEQYWLPALEEIGIVDIKIPDEDQRPRW